MREIRYNIVPRSARREGDSLPPIRKKNDGAPYVLCVTCGDIHLSDQAPVSRADVDWYEAMARPIRQMRAIMKEHNAPLLCAGDIFDRWNSSAALINFALRELPQMYAVPGQHDLPHHRYEDIKKSAYWTLCEAGKVCNLMPDRRMPVDDRLLVCGFPWGFDVKPIDHQPLLGHNVALIHSYIWKKDCGYPGAPPDKHLGKWAERLKGYSVAVFADNHKNFLLHPSPKRSTSIINGGSFMRRKSDEIDHKPFVGLIWSDGSVSSEYLDCSEDVLLPKQEALAREIEACGGFEAFLESVRELGNSTSDFIEAVEAALRKKVSPRVRELVREAIEKK